MGGLPAVLHNFHPAELWVGNNPHTEPYDALLREAAGLNVSFEQVRVLSLSLIRVTVGAVLLAGFIIGMIHVTG